MLNRLRRPHSEESHRMKSASFIQKERILHYLEGKRSFSQHTKRVVHPNYDCRVAISSVVEVLSLDMVDLFCMSVSLIGVSFLNKPRAQS